VILLGSTTFQIHNRPPWNVPVGSDRNSPSTRGFLGSNVLLAKINIETLDAGLTARTPRAHRRSGVLHSSSEAQPPSASATWPRTTDDLNGILILLLRLTTDNKQPPRSNLSCVLGDILANLMLRRRGPL
jgi:hypothetical protein